MNTQINSAKTLQANKTGFDTTANRLWSIAATALSLAAAVLISGCVSVGHTFDYGAASKLELGQLTSSNYRSVFGEKPDATSQQMNAEGKYEIARYTFAHADMGSAKARTLVLEFKNGTLNAYVYVSSFDGETTSVPMDKVNQIKNGQTTKAEVLNLLGKPNGKALCPSVLDDFKGRCSGNSEVWMWMSLGSVSTFGAAYGGKQPPVTTLYVLFDTKGIVSQIESANASAR